MKNLKNENESGNTWNLDNAEIMDEKEYQELLDWFNGKPL